MPAVSFARGRKAWGICKRCSLRFLLSELRYDGQYRFLLVCSGCWDPAHGQERLTPARDPISLYRPSPDRYPLLPPVLTAELGSVLLAWTRAEHELDQVGGYTVFKAIGADGDFEELIDYPMQYDYIAQLVAGTEHLAYTDEDVEGGVTYQYFVRAVSRAWHYIANSNIVSIVPEAGAPVLTLDVTTDEETVASLTWTETAPEDGDYALYRAINAGSFALLTTQLGVEYFDTDFAVGDVLRYYVVARSADLEEGPASNTVLYTPPGPVVVSGDIEAAP